MSEYSKEVGRGEIYIPDDPRLAHACLYGIIPVGEMQALAGISSEKSRNYLFWYNSLIYPSWINRLVVMTGGPYLLPLSNSSMTKDEVMKELEGLGTEQARKT